MSVERRTRTYEEVHIDDALPELVVPLTTTLIVAGAIASRDFYPGHHDKDLAQQLGMKDVFMNILTSGGWVGRYVTDWAGPDAVVKNISIRLGVPNYPGDTMVISGRIVAKAVVDATAAVTLALRVSNGLGEHCTGTAEIVLPVGDEGR